MKVTIWLERYAIAFILSYRFIYGVRNVSSIAIGMSNLSWRSFIIWNAIAALIWASVFAGVGYFFGNVIAQLPETTVIQMAKQIMLSILGVFVLFLGVKKISKWK